MSNLEISLKTVHAHDVMDMMMASGKTYSRESLAREIRSTFGMEARFEACSASDMTPEELIEFLDCRGKLSGSEDAFVFDPGGKCSGH